jgi:hypothetical protein
MVKYKKGEIQAFITNKDPLLECVKPKKTPKSSQHWSSFSQVFYKKVKQDVIQCDACKLIFIHRSIDGTRFMSGHRIACKASNQSDTDQRNLHAYMSPKNPIAKNIPSKLRKSITNACVEFAAMDSRAFETVNGDGFISLIETVFTAGQRLSSLSSVRVNDLLPDPTTVNS